MSIDQLIDTLVSDAQLATGENPAWMLKNGGVARPSRSVAQVRAHSWTPEEDAFLREYLPTLGFEGVGEALGRDANSCKIRQFRMGIPAASKQPGWITANRCAKLLGLDDHKVCAWIDRGILPGERLPWSRRAIRRVKLIRLKMWLTRPESWVYVDARKIQQPGIRRLVFLAQARWGDEWWTTAQAAEYLGCPVTDVTGFVTRGRLPGLQARFLGGRDESTWAFWYVRKSHVMAFKKPAYSDSKLSFTPAGDAFMLKARIEWGLSPAIIARMMKRTTKSIGYRIHYLGRRQGITIESLQGKTLRKPKMSSCIVCGQPFLRKSGRSARCEICRADRRRQLERERYARMNR